jgi:hypothetical protein
MHKSTKWLGIAGLVLHVLIAALMIFAGSVKVFIAPPALVEGMGKNGLGDQILLIGAGELITAVLLVVPRTASLGVLLTSAFWGGAIVAHMSHAEAYAMQSVLLALTWLGAYLRLPAMFSSFAGARGVPAATQPSASIAA